MIWSLLAGGIYFSLKRDTRTAVVVGIALLSHWILDFITHRPDMPILFGGTMYVGLGLWNSLAGTLIVEVTMFIIGAMLYLRATRARDRIGSYGLWCLLLFFSRNVLCKLIRSSTTK